MKVAILYNGTSIARTSLGPWKFVLDMDSQILTAVQEANGIIWGCLFDLMWNNGMLGVLIRTTSMR